MRTIMLDVDGVLVRGRPHDGAHLFTDLEKDLGLSLEQLQGAFFKPRWRAIVTGQKPLLCLNSPKCWQRSAAADPDCAARGRLEAGAQQLSRGGNPR